MDKVSYLIECWSILLLFQIDYSQEYEYPLKRVPPGHCFLVGDNLALSNDSRQIGPVPLGLIQVRMVYRVWPLSRMGWLSKHWFYERTDGTL
jgi:hypothetical protein